jgi:hypothetical protein
MTVYRNNAQYTRCYRGAAIATRLPLHQDKFYVILDDGIRFIRLPEKPRAVTFRLILGISDLVPDYRGEVREANLSALFLD